MAQQRDRDDLLFYLVGEVKEVKQDVKNLLKFKWQIMAGAGIIGFIFSSVITVITLAKK